MSDNTPDNDENDKVWLTAVRVPAVILLGLIVMAVVGYVITR